MREDFLKNFNKLGVSKKAKILLAVSGGIDSMVLMDLFDKIGCQFSVAHCNFCLRGLDSDTDEQFISSISQSMNIEFFVQRFNTKEYAIEKKISIQMAARELRYDWFKDLQKKYNFDFIATAHHYDDSIETVLMNLIRGTGFTGLQGIRKSNNTLIRPLLEFHKNDILTYAKDNQVNYREDSSNSDDKYLRNKIRNKIIPLMKEINPNVIKSIGKAVSSVNSVEKLYRHTIEKKQEELLEISNDEHKLNIPTLLKEISPKQILYEIISQFGFFDIDSVFKSLSSDSGKEFFNSDYYMVKDRNELIISKHITGSRVLIEQRVNSVKNPFTIEFNVLSLDKLSIETKSKNEMYIDYSKLSFPLLIRPWRKGDKFIPLGMKGFKKVSDYFVDNKFSLIKKKKTRLLISDNEIVCIIGERLDERFKLVENSKKVYIVKL